MVGKYSRGFDHYDLFILFGWCSTTAIAFVACGIDDQFNHLGRTIHALRRRRQCCAECATARAGATLRKSRRANQNFDDVSSLVPTRSKSVQIITKPFISHFQRERPTQIVALQFSCQPTNVAIFLHKYTACPFAAKRQSKTKEILRV